MDKNSTQNTDKDYAKKLREVQQLYKEGLLTEQEYQEKRNDILDEDWGR